jgi:hypothetical protein
MRKLAFAAALLLMSPASMAQQGVPLVKSMTADELSGCAKLSVGIASQQSSIQAEDTRLYEAGLKIRGEASAIDDARPKVDLRDPKQIAAFNKRILANGVMVDRYNNAIAKRNLAARKASGDQDMFNVQCANRPYDDKDLALLPPDQQQAMREDSKRIEIPLLYSPGSPPAPSDAGFTIGGPPPPPLQFGPAPSDPASPPAETAPKSAN